MRVQRLNRTANSVSPSALLSPAKHDGRVPPADGRVYAGKKRRRKERNKTTTRRRLRVPVKQMKPNRTARRRLSHRRLQVDVRSRWYGFIYGMHDD